MTQNRVQVGEFGKAQLQPAALPSDTFAAPAQAPIDRRFEATAQALSFFNQAVGTLGSVIQQASQMKPSEADQWAAQRRIMGMTNEEFNAAVDRGEMDDYMHPVRNAAAAKITGNRLGQIKATEVMQHLQTDFDWDNGDVDAYVTGVYNGLMEQYGDNHIVGSQITSAFSSLRNDVTEYARNRQNEMANELRTDAAYIAFDTLLQNSIIGGADPQAAAEAMYRSYASLGREGTLGVGYDDLDARLLMVAARAAATDPEYAEAILFAEGPDGRTLASSPRHVGRVDTIRSDIAKGRWTIQHNQNMAALDQQNMEIFLDGGNLGGIPEYVYTDLNGQRQTISAEAQAERAASQYAEYSRRQSAEYGETQFEQITREAITFNQAGLTHSQLSGSLNGISRLATVGTMLDPEAEAQLVEKLKMGIAVSSHDPLILQAHVTDPADRAFIEAFQIGAATLDMSDSEAIQFAGMVANAGNVTLGRDAQDAVTRAVSEFNPGFWAWAFSGGTTTDIGNTYLAEQRITEYATAIVAGTGASPERAVELAGEMVKRTHLPYRGQLLDLGGMAIPQDISSAFDAYIEDYARSNPEFMTDRGWTADDLTVINRGSSFYVVNKDDYSYALHDDNDRPRVLSLNDLREWENWRNQRQAEWDAQQASMAVEGVHPDWATYTAPNQPQVDDDATSRGYTRAADGFYKDAEGNRYMPLPAPTGSRIDWVRQPN